MVPTHQSRGRSPWPFKGSVRQGELLAYKLTLDGRIKVGRAYLVRPTNRSEYLFGGKPLRLVQVRVAEYCYRMTFDVRPEDCTDPLDDKSRCIYSDNWQPAGLALTPVPGSRHVRRH